MQSVPPHKTLILKTQVRIANLMHCATTLVQTNSNKQRHITAEINVNYLPKLFIILAKNLLINETI